MEKYVIPRNIRIRETVAYGLSAKQVIYIAVGVGASLAVWSISGIPLIGIVEKAFGTILCVSGALGLSLAKRHGQELDKYILNSIKYPLRTKEFGGEEDGKKGIVLRINYSLE